MITTIDNKPAVKAKHITVEIDGTQYVISEESGMLKLRAVEKSCYMIHSIEPNTFKFISDLEEI